MSVHVVANENAKKEFIIPVSWEVYDTIRVQADSLEEAMNWAENNIDEIPLGDDPEYIDGSYQINNDESFVSLLNKKETRD